MSIKILNTKSNQDKIFKTLNGCIPRVGDCFRYESKYGGTKGVIKSVSFNTIVSTNGITYKFSEIKIMRAEVRDSILNNLLEYFDI